MREIHIHDNKRYVDHWFALVPETMSYRHKVEGIEVSREKMDELIHTERLPNLLNMIGINHANVLKKMGYTENAK